VGNFASIKRLAQQPPFQVGAFNVNNGNLVVYGANPLDAYLVYNTKTASVSIPSSENDSGWGEPFDLWYDREGTLWALYLTKIQLTFVFITVGATRTTVTPIYTIPMPPAAQSISWLTGVFDPDRKIYILTSRIGGFDFVKIDLNSYNATFVQYTHIIFMPVYSLTKKAIYAVANTTTAVRLLKFSSSLDIPTIVATYGTYPVVNVPNHLVLDEDLSLAYIKMDESNFLVCSTKGISSPCTLHPAATITAARLFWCPG
jgi:hypothetical protein